MLSLYFVRVHWCFFLYSILFLSSDMNSSCFWWQTKLQSHTSKREKEKKKEKKNAFQPTPKNRIVKIDPLVFPSFNYAFSSLFNQDVWHQSRRWKEIPHVEERWAGPGWWSLLPGPERHHQCNADSNRWVHEKNKPKMGTQSYIMYWQSFRCFFWQMIISKK